jgi:hypothetical protein
LEARERALTAMKWPCNVAYAVGNYLLNVAYRSIWAPETFLALKPYTRSEKPSYEKTVRTNKYAYNV